jgi:hypothetical protein
MALAAPLLHIKRAAAAKCTELNHNGSFSALPTQLDRVSPEPASPPGTALGLGKLPSLAETTGALAGAGQAAQLTVLHDGADHPVDLGVASDALVVRVDHDDLEVLVGGVLSDPVRVEDAESLEAASDALLCDGLKVPLRLLLLDGTRALGLTERGPLGHGALPAAATHGNAVDDIAWDC